MYKKKYVLIIIISSLLFLFGCISGTSSTDSLISPDVSKTPTNISEYTNIKGRVTVEDDSISLLGIEIYLKKTGEIVIEETEESTDESSNLNRATDQSAYDYKILTDSTGSFSAVNVETGIYEITVIKADYSMSVLKDITIDDNDVINVTLSVPGSVRAKVFLEEEVKYGVKFYVDSSLFLTDDEGNVEVALGSGTHEIIIEEFGYITYSKVIDVESDKILDLGDIVIEKSYINPDYAVLKSKIISSFGENISGALVMLSSVENEYTVFTDSLGKFQINNIVPDTYVLKIINNTFGSTNILELEAGNLTELDSIVIDNMNKYGVIKLNVSRESLKSDVLDIKIYQNDEEINAYISDEIIGEFNILGLSTGDYRIEIESLSYEKVEKDFSVQAGEEDDVLCNLILKKSVFSGKVTDGKGNPVITEVEFGSEFSYTDNEGNFSFEDVPEGNYSIYIKSFGFNDYYENISVESGVDIIDHSIALSSKNSDGIDSIVNMDFRVEKAVDGGNLLYLLSDDRKNIYSYSKENGIVESVLNVDGNIQDYAVIGTVLYYIDSFSGNINMFSLESGTLIKNVYSGLEPVRIITDTENIFVLSRGDNRLYIFSHDLSQSDYYETGFNPQDMTLNEKSIFIADRYGNAIKVFDVQNKLFGSTISGFTRPLKLYAYNNQIFVVKENSTEVDVLSAITYSDQGTLNTGYMVSDIKMGYEKLYLSASNIVAVYDNSLALNKLLNVSPDISGILEDSQNTNKLYIFKKYENKMIIYYCN